MNPICLNCSDTPSQMVCVKTGITVAPSHNPFHTYSGDVYRCENCDNSVIIGISKEAYQSQKEAEILLDN